MNQELNQGRNQGLKQSLLLGMASIGVIAATVTAGFEVAPLTFTEMIGGGGIVDFGDPFATGDAEFIIIDDPVPGTFIDMWFGVSGQGVFGSDTTFGSFNDGVALFHFQHSLNVGFFGDDPDADFAFAGARLTFTALAPIEVTLIASLGATPTGFGFLEVYGDGDPDGEIFTTADNPIFVQFVVGPGTYDLGWGAGVINAGGNAALSGTLAFRVVPAPGAIALLALAGLAASRRRR
ncbi:MAG: hypothetical protein FJ257_02420 [Phycisphaerae bacterium]|nr:hypothetical protein [Phycisphaerae bacterium]